MTNSQRLSAVRTALRKWISDRHPDQGDCDRPLSEAMLIREGFFCGRRFRFQLYHAVWFMEEDEVKIQSLQGEVVERLATSAIDALATAWHQDTESVQHTLSIAAHLDSAAAAGEQHAADSHRDEQQQRRAA